MYTKVPNGLIEAMPDMKGSVFAVCMAVCRKTLGHHRVWDKISTAQFEKLTGLSNRAVIDAVNTAVANGWMIRKRDGDSYQYKIKGAEEILPYEESSHKDVAKNEDSATFMCEQSSYPYEESSQGGYEESSYTKEITTQPTVVAAQPQIPLAQQFQVLLKELGATKNRAAKLVEIYILLYGKDTAPSFGYILKVANQIGGAGFMAHKLWELSARPPNGDILAYLVAEHKGKNARLNAAQRNGNHGGNSDPAIWHKLGQEQDIPEYMREIANDD